MGVSHVVAPPKPGNTTNMVGICSRLRINELQISPSSIAVARPLTSVVPCYSTLKSWAGVTRGWDVHRSNSLWLPSNGKPIPVDILICQNVVFFHVYNGTYIQLREEKNQQCAQACPQVVESSPFLGASQAQSRTWSHKLVLSPQGACEPCVYSSIPLTPHRCHLGLWVWLSNGSGGCGQADIVRGSQSTWPPFKPGG